MPLSEDQVAALHNSICAQIEEPVDLNGKNMNVNADIESFTIIPFTDKVEIIVNPEMLGGN